MDNLEYDYVEEIEHFTKVLKGLEKDYDKLLKLEKELAGVKRDIRHIYELGDLDSVDFVKLSEVYTENLRERREVIKSKRVLTRIKVLIQKKYPDIKDEMSYVMKEIIKDKNKERNYYAKSSLGQELIDEFSNIDDDLITSPSKDDLKGLKELERKFNASS
jgi:hypothetical protein